MGGETNFCSAKGVIINVRDNSDLYAVSKWTTKKPFFSYTRGEKF